MALLPCGLVAIFQPTTEASNSSWPFPTLLSLRSLGFQVGLDKVEMVEVIQKSLRIKRGQLVENQALNGFDIMMSCVYLCRMQIAIEQSLQITP